MRVIAAAVLWAFAACSYDDPSLTFTEFRCTQDTECPDGQKCAGTICVVATHDGVACMAEQCPPFKKCCLDGTNPPRCIPAEDVCFGVSAGCDGVEDCAAGGFCCEQGVVSSCAGVCATYTCQDRGDCPSAEPNCCPGSETRPWKFCQTDPC